MRIEFFFLILRYNDRLVNLRILFYFNLKEKEFKVKERIMCFFRDNYILREDVFEVYKILFKLLLYYIE